jgi:hypothetical protein
VSGHDVRDAILYPLECTNKIIIADNNVVEGRTLGGRNDWKWMGRGSASQLS